MSIMSIIVKQDVILYGFYVHGSMHHELMSIIVQQDVTLYSFYVHGSVHRESMSIIAQNVFMFMGPCIVNQCQ
jgi:hypothetical protein